MANKTSRGLTGLLEPKRLSQFADWLRNNGAEILAPTNEFELIRFRAANGTHIAYRNKTGTTIAASGEGFMEAWRCHCGGQTWRAMPAQSKPVIGKRRRTLVAALITRDGDECFYCGSALGEDITIEHLVGRTQGGPNHICNLALAHEACNKDGGSLSVVEKVRMREGRFAKRESAHKEIA